MVDFRIYYGDGSTYIGVAEESPADNVQCIAWDDPDKTDINIGRVVLREWDFYIYSEGIGWHGANKYCDLLLHLTKRPCKVRAICLGEWMHSGAYQEIIKRAETDGKPKSGIDPIREDGSE